MVVWALVVGASTVLVLLVLRSALVLVAWVLLLRMVGVLGVAVVVAAPPPLREVMRAARVHSVCARCCARRRRPPRLGALADHRRRAHSLMDGRVVDDAARAPEHSKRLHG